MCYLIARGVRRYGSVTPEADMTDSAWRLVCQGVRYYSRCERRSGYRIVARCRRSGDSGRVEVADSMGTLRRTDRILAAAQRRGGKDTEYHRAMGALLGYRPAAVALFLRRHRTRGLGGPGTLHRVPGRRSVARPAAAGRRLGPPVRKKFPVGAPLGDG